MDGLINKSRPGEYIVFSINEQLCALSTEGVIEIIRIQPLTDVPEVSDYIPDVINLLICVETLWDASCIFSEEKKNHCCQ